MHMNIILSLIVLACVFRATSLNITGDPSVSMRLIGSADGKSLFADSGYRAKDDCKGYSMRLASITTLEQAKVLKNAYGSGIDNIYYWTAGNEKTQLNQFRWDHNNQVPPANLLSYRNNDPPRACLYYYYSGTYGTYGAANCDRRFGVICETSM